ncbi:MAG TPA: Hpt domain-containing protein, partial [Terriglobales bacterium]|nr:Hpt domain-containing protein [Terriglobales bacterium]
MSFFSEERAAELRDLFFESAQELLQTLNEQGLDLEKSPGEPEVVRGIRRTVHTIKGDSAACGFRELSDLAHELEDVLKPEFAASTGNALAELVLSAADMFDAMLAAYRGNMQPPKADPLRIMISRLMKNPASSASRNELVPKFQWTEYDLLAMQNAHASGSNVFGIAVAIDRSCPMRAAAVQLVLNVIAETGTILARKPEEIPADGSVDIVEVAVSTKLTEAQLQHKCRVPTVVEKIVVHPWHPATKPVKHTNDQDVLGIDESTTVAEPAAELEEAIAASAASQLAETPAKPKSRVSEFTQTENTLRVDADRIDTVMNLVGELIIGKSMLYQTINEFGRRYPKDPLKNRFTDALSKQAQVLNALQRSVMKIRMVPVDQLFRRFPRVLRDASKACGKEVELITVGHDTDLDKGILDSLAEPLTHLLRNAVDHGIETPQERVAAGKS